MCTQSFIQSDILDLLASLAVSFEKHYWVCVRSHSISGKKISAPLFNLQNSPFAERPDGGQARLQPSIPPAILETALDFLLKPSQSPCFLPLYWSLLSLHISGIQSRAHFR